MARELQLEEKTDIPQRERELLGRGLEWHFTGMWGSKDGEEGGTQAQYIVLHHMKRAFQLVVLRRIDLQIVW